MKLEEQKWHNEVNAFTSASLREGSWIESLELLADATGSRSGQLIGLGDDKAVPFNFVSDFDPEWNEVFKSADGRNPAVNPFVRAGAKCSFDAILSSADFFPNEQRRYNDKTRLIRFGK